MYDFVNNKSNTSCGLSSCSRTRRLERDNGKPDHIFRDLVDATATVTITAAEIVARFQKRAHNPLFLAAGLGRASTPISWLGGKSLRLVFGK
jgi:hypothetical protein